MGPRLPPNMIKVIEGSREWWGADNGTKLIVECGIFICFQHLSFIFFSPVQLSSELSYATI